MTSAAIDRLPVPMRVLAMERATPNELSSAGMMVAIRLERFRQERLSREYHTKLFRCTYRGRLKRGRA